MKIMTQDKITLIGVSGKIGSGKDTIGKIIQYLTDKSKAGYSNPDTLQDFESYCKNHKEKYSTFHIKKYAFKLKQIASLLIGIPVEDFEKEEVKDSLLSEEWIRYGYANGFFQKNGETIMNNEACSKEKYEEEFRTNWQTAYKHEYTVRSFLQLLGTEAIRDKIHINAWVNALFADYNPNIYWMCDNCGNENLSTLITIPNRFKDIVGIENENVCPICKGKESEGDITQVINTNSSNWIITDVRFPNELEAIYKRNGICIRVNRGITTPTGMYLLDKSDNTPDEFVPIHPSETALDEATFTYTINNNGTIEELIDQIKQILIKEKIL